MAPLAQTAVVQPVQSERPLSTGVVMQINLHWKKSFAGSFPTGIPPSPQKSPVPQVLNSGPCLPSLAAASQPEWPPLPALHGGEMKQESAAERVAAIHWGKESV